MAMDITAQEGAESWHISWSLCQWDPSLPCAALLTQPDLLPSSSGEACRTDARGGALHLLVEQVDVKLAAGDHRYPELCADLVVQRTQRAHEQLPVRHHRQVAGLGWRVCPQGCAKVMLCTSRAAAAVSRSHHSSRTPALSRPWTAPRLRARLHPCLRAMAGWGWRVLQ